ncbi:SGNH/GDSL hydrolase family protein [Falsibacillus pallidus]|uniref:Lysophospholipase L1-like esterase n=1 Tax=Falsibacillus pallidus TaxID=493781 RepID=A0A370GK65_9BACI|nr:GDSL-type esterase/lipase family protein [Falsibacillus pallidus]RDI42333.1 lysophospholipase L1-like esterase [Falsibacillus pallidus]
MNKYIQRTAVAIIFIILFNLFTLFDDTHAKKAYGAQETYLALGDSLAAGMTPYNGIGPGYADMIALALKSDDRIAGFSKDFAIPGYTSGQVLDLLQQKEVQLAVSRADIITLSAGANDLLQVVRSDPGHLTVSYEQLQANFALNQVRLNEEKILTLIRQLNPRAQIAVMGYYFPYPHILNSHKKGIGEELDILNDILQEAAEKHGAFFVPVSQGFGLDAKELVPNPEDVHPTPKGYLAMANAFLSIFTPGKELPKGILDNLPAPMPLSDFIEKKKALMQPASVPSEQKHQPAAARTTQERVYK